MSICLVWREIEKKLCTEFSSNDKFLKHIFLKKVLCWLVSYTDDALSRSAKVHRGSSQFHLETDSGASSLTERSCRLIRYVIIKCFLHKAKASGLSLHQKGFSPIVTEKQPLKID